MHLSACIRENKPVGFPMVRLRVFDRLIAGSKTWGAKNLCVRVCILNYTPARVFWLTDKLFFKKVLWFEQKYVITIFCNLQIIDFSHLKSNMFIPIPCMVSSVQFSSVQSLSCVWLSDPMNCSAPGLPVHHQLPEFTQTHVHRVSDAIQPSHPLLSPSPPAPNPSQHQGFFQWVNSSHEVAKVLEFQL